MREYAKQLVGWVLICALLLSTAALAEVRTTGNVNLRSGPGLDYATIASVQSGVSRTYLGQTSVDDRGVAWYEVDYDGACWISSKYAELIGEVGPSIVDIAGQLMQELNESGAVYSEHRGEINWDAEAARDYIDVSQYYLKDLEEAAEALALSNFEEVASEAPNQYFDDSLTIGGYSIVEYFNLCGPGYTFFGAAPGMEIAQVKELLAEAGLVLYDDDGDVVIFEHRASEESLYDSDGFDSCINVWCQNGVVTQMDWSAYTG